MHNNPNSVWDFFEERYCLNLDSRPNRWEQALKEFEIMGLNVERFPALYDIDPQMSFNISQTAMLDSFIASGKETALLFEDDVVFKQNVGVLQAALYELPKDWDVLFLGTNVDPNIVDYARQRMPKRYSQHLCRIFHCFTTHSVAYRRNAAIKIVEKYDKKLIYDAWLNRDMLFGMKVYCITPMLAFQRPGVTDLWKGEDKTDENNKVDYTRYFNMSDHILKNSR